MKKGLRMNNIFFVSYLVFSVISMAAYFHNGEEKYFYLVYLFLILSGIERAISEIKKIQDV